MQTVGCGVLRHVRFSILVLASTWLWVGCSAAIHETTATEVATQFLFFKKGEDGNKDGVLSGAEGGMGDLWVEVAGNPGGRAPVRFAETVSGGVGDGWRAAVWMALLSASAVLDVDPFSLRVSVEADDAVDGPSAGALTTVAIMAAVRKEPFLPNAVMTGTVNPDLTIGPVGGIPEKVLAAAKAGKRRIGIPVGQNRALSLRTGRVVDVVALAQKHRAKVFILRDVTDAYEAMTGVRIAVPKVLTPAQMALPDWLGTVFDEEAGRILDQVADAQRDLRELFARVPNTDGYSRLKAARARLLQDIGNVRKLIGKKDPVSAVYRATGVHHSHFRLTTSMLLQMGRDLGRWEYVGKLLRNLRMTVAATLESTVPEWQAYVAQDPIEVPYVVDTFEALLHAIRGMHDARRVLSQHTALRRLVQEEGYVPPNARAVKTEALWDFTRNLIDGQSNLLLGRAYFAVGQAWLRRNPRRAGSKRIPRDVVRDLATQYQRVADANLQYVDALLIKSALRGSRMSRERARMNLMNKDDDYRQAVMNRRIPELMTANKKVFSADEQAFVLMSGAVSSYFSSATVISKRYSLGAEIDERTGAVTNVKHRAAFESMLELADRQARQVAAQCMDLFGEVPFTALIEYDYGRRLDAQGRALRARDKTASVQLRLQALSHLWRSYTLGRLAIATHRRLANSANPY